MGVQILLIAEKAQPQSAFLILLREDSEFPDPTIYNIVVHISLRAKDEESDPIRLVECLVTMGKEQALIALLWQVSDQRLKLANQK